MENYRTAHAIAVRQTQGQANTEDLRHAVIHYRTLFEDLVGAPEVARATTQPPKAARKIGELRSSFCKTRESREQSAETRSRFTRGNGKKLQRNNRAPSIPIPCHP
jgi:hypothetical protein